MAQPDHAEALRRAIAHEHLLYLELRKHERLAARWQQRAELALRRGEQELAREALQRKAEEDRLCAVYRGEYLAQGQAIRNAKRPSRRVRPINPAAADQRLQQMALEDRLDRDLAALKAQLKATSA